MHYKRVWKHGDPSYVPSRSVCDIVGCDRFVNSNGLCSMHVRRLAKNGDLEARSRGRRTQFACSVDGCEGQAIARHLCGKHYARWKTHGDPTVNRRGKAAFRATLDWRNVDDVRRMCWGQQGSGYRGAIWPEHPSASPKGYISEHSAVMCAVLGRPLLKGESVHHRNGVRHDNRPENLELWASAHRPGQRVTDLIADAHELLERYKDDLQLWPEHLRP
jgi:hypothetical protein